MGRRGAPLESPERAPLAEPPVAERPGGFFFGGRQYFCSVQVARQVARAVTGQVAQLVEHATENRGVGGSIPPLATEGLEGEGWEV